MVVKLFLILKKNYFLDFLNKMVSFGEALKTFNQYSWKTNKTEGG